MKPEVTPAAVVLCCLVVGLLVYDFATSRGRSRRMLLLQAAVFVAGGLLIVFPGVATSLAHTIGIGRGVDFVLYPLVIWLVRESLLSRRRRHEDAEKLTAAVRALAVESAREAHSSGRNPAHSDRSSASLST